jgi:hypothetical protein
MGYECAFDDFIRKIQAANRRNICWFASVNMDEEVFFRPSLLFRRL